MALSVCVAGSFLGKEGFTIGPDDTLRDSPIQSLSAESG
jgi:hypothetical protein